VRGISISLEIGNEFVQSFAPMKLSHRVAALAAVALLLPGLRAFAQKASPSSGDEFEQDDSKPQPKSPETAPPEAPPEPAAINKLAAPPPPAAPAPASDNPYVPFEPPPAPLGIEVPNASIHFGLLAQPQVEVAGGPDATLTSKNIFLRRIRFMVGGTLYKYFEFFFDTDYPNLFKSDAGDTMAGPYKNAPGLNIQDAYITFKPLGELVKLDAGFMLPPGSHNRLESAAKLYSTDYFANTFRRNLFQDTDSLVASAGENPIGRDLGIQLRALVLGGHLEARAGVFQGVRDNQVPGPPAEVANYNLFRFAGRVQVNVLDAEPGFFYQGTYLGTKKILSFGGFYDFQRQPSTGPASYSYYGGDAILDLPLGPGIITVEAEYARWNDVAGVTITTLDNPPKTVVPTNAAFMAQAGYLIAPIMLSPFVQYEHLVAPETATGMDSMGNPALVPDPGNPSENRYSGGLSFWPYGHNVNLKLLVAHVTRNPAPHAFNQVNVQWQLYFF
jgi:hypothetical protein